MLRFVYFYLSQSMRQALVKVPWPEAECQWREDHIGSQEAEREVILTLRILEQLSFDNSEVCQPLNPLQYPKHFSLGLNG